VRGSKRCVRAAKPDRAELRQLIPLSSFPWVSPPTQLQAPCHEPPHCLIPAQHMMGTGDFSMKDEQGQSVVTQQAKAEAEHVSNNYARPGGQVCMQAKLPLTLFVVAWCPVACVVPGGEFDLF